MALPVTTLDFLGLLQGTLNVGFRQFGQRYGLPPVLCPAASVHRQSKLGEINITGEDDSKVSFDLICIACSFGYKERTLHKGLGFELTLDSDPQF